jgi:hypothetical protein
MIIYPVKFEVRDRLGPFVRSIQKAMGGYSSPGLGENEVGHRVIENITQRRQSKNLLLRKSYV